MKYRKLHGYKYELMDGVEIRVDLPLTRVNNYLGIYDYPEHCQDKPRYVGHFLGVSCSYAWDGASGPTWDDKTNMRASLVHDALYQLMREELLDRKHRKYADELFRKMCIEDGMGKFRAWYYYRAVRIFGARTCKPEKNPRGQVIEI